MAALLQRKPLTIKQQVEELKNWHKQQQSKLNPDKNYKVNSSNKCNEVKDVNLSSVSKTTTNFDEMPVKGANDNFNTIVENNVTSFDSHLPAESGILEKNDGKPKFRFLKKGEGIARFNMGPSKVVKRNIPKKQINLKLTKDTTNVFPRNNKDSPEKQTILHDMGIMSSDNTKNIPTLKVPDVKLNFTWKSILSGENPEDMLEKAIASNQLELMDLNSSIDSSTASLMERLLAIGKNKLLRDKEELRVFEAIEQHMLDSSFCSTSSYVGKLMENAVMSTPNKETSQNQQNTNTTTDEGGQSTSKQQRESNRQTSGSHSMSNPQALVSTIDSQEKTTKLSNSEMSKSKENGTEPKKIYPIASWTNPETTEDLEHSLHVRFSELVDYKSFVEKSQSVGSPSSIEENLQAEFDESQEWIQDNEDSSSCCSQCSKNESLTEEIRPFGPQKILEENNQAHSQSKKNISDEKLHASEQKTNFIAENNDLSNDLLTDWQDNFPPLLIAKIKELEEEIKIFREENSSVKILRESLEKERKLMMDEKRRLNLEKRKFQKEMEEEQKRLTAQLEEEKQKLAKEKITFEKYSKSISKNPSREERKEIQALRDQLSEMKEELNKKESRWGAAQARVRNQVKVLEEDNKKLREEIENFRKQAKYWEIFNQKKKGKLFNNTRLIHAISEHISNIVLDDEETNSKNDVNSKPKTSTVAKPDLKSFYGVKVIQENQGNKNSSSQGGKTSKPISNPISGDLILDNEDVGIIEEDFNKDKLSCSSKESELQGNTMKFQFSQTAFGDGNHQNNDRCQKPCLESSNSIKETTDESGNVEIKFPNGNIKRVNKISGSEKYIYVNGDVEEITHNGTVKYYYSKSRIWQTTLPDGLEIVDFPDGKVEKRHNDGTVEIVYANNNKKISYPNGSQEIIYADGTKLRIEADKTQVLTLPNGQKEIHTDEWKRREYPDGTRKTLYPDGTTETVYSNGRVRLKDKYGNLVMDSGSPQCS